MAALRVYLALALLIDFKSRRVTVSWSDLQSLTGLSRPMITEGLNTARQLGWVEIDRSGRTHSYHLRDPANDGGTVNFIQVPRLLDNVLAQLPTRGYHALDALKVYVTLLGMRGRNSDVAAISHKKIVEWSGVQPRRVRPAIDVLINHRLVHVRSVESTSVGHPHHEYQLNGLRAERSERAEAASAAFTEQTALEEISF